MGARVQLRCACVEGGDCPLHTASDVAVALAHVEEARARDPDYRPEGRYAAYVARQEVAPTAS